MKKVLVRPLWGNLFFKASYEKAKKEDNVEYIYYIKERFVMKLLKRLCKDA